MPGTLYVVATPIGNLADASPRALEVLRSVELVACEDTRTTRTLLARHGIAARTVALHGHNERTAARKLIERLRAGASVALVSDAGTPAVSDPGALLVAEAHRAGVPVSPIPGPSAALAAFSASGFAAGGFLFAGFLAPGAAAVDALESPWPVVLYEAPHRIAQTLAALLARFGPGHEVVVARELTKKFEEVARMPLGEAPAWLEAQPHRRQGEFVLVLAPAPPSAAKRAPDPRRVLALLLEVLPASDAARIAARITGLPRRELYAAALESASTRRK